MSTVLQALRRWACRFWTGHDWLLVIEPGKLSVMCQTCGYASPGWDVEMRAPQTNVVAFPERRRA